MRTPAKLRPRPPRTCALPEPLPERDPVPCFWLRGVLHRRICDGSSVALLPIEERGGQRLYRLTEPGTYDAMLADRIVSIVCWKGQVEVKETLFY